MQRTIHIDLPMICGTIKLGAGVSKHNENLILTVASESAAERAGLQPGDIVNTFNGKDLSAEWNLPRVLSECTESQVAVLNITRPLAAVEDNDLKEQPTRLLSVKLKLSANKKTGLKLLGSRVLEITPGSPAETAGLLPGDVTLAADGIPLTPEYTLKQVIEKRVMAEWTTILLIRRQCEPGQEQDGMSDAGSAVSGISGTSIMSESATSRSTLR
mmetsp:Transcript_16102/g.34550  ORF Transcript_16102/g.34550 Transcript_16102/m.34550 type:complete len:215 (-) Transcript_16102:1032-1676(-)